MSSEENNSKSLKLEILEKLSTLIAASFGFVAAFAWNETFKVILLNRMTDADKPIMLIGYSLLVTIIAVLLIILVSKAVRKAKSFK